MNRTLKISFITALLFAVIAGTAIADQFTDPSSTFSFTTPNGWVAQETPDVVAYTAANEVSQINITSEPSNGVTLNDFIKHFAGELKMSLQKFKLISSGKTKIGGEPAGCWVYSAKIDGVSLQFKSYVVFKGETMYNIIFCTTPALFKTDVAGVDTIKNTWSWSVN